LIVVYCDRDCDPSHPSQTLLICLIPQLEGRGQFLAGKHLGTVCSVIDNRCDDCGGLHEICGHYVIVNVHIGVVRDTSVFDFTGVRLEVE